MGQTTYSYAYDLTLLGEEITYQKGNHRSCIMSTGEKEGNFKIPVFNCGHQCERKFVEYNA